MREPCSETFYWLPKCVDPIGVRAGTTHSERTMNVTWSIWPCVIVWLTTGVPRQLTEQRPPTALPGGRSLARWAEPRQVGGTFALLSHTDWPSWHSTWSGCDISACVLAVLDCTRHWLQLTDQFDHHWPPVCPSLCLPLADWPTDHCLASCPSFRQV